MLFQKCFKVSDSPDEKRLIHGEQVPQSYPTSVKERLHPTTGNVQITEQTPGAARPRKKPSKLRQTQLPLEIVSKGRFDKSEPTIHKGEDLDVPTYIRRGVSLN